MEPELACSDANREGPADQQEWLGSAKNPVEVTGLEPVTSALQRRRSTN